MLFSDVSMSKYCSRAYENVPERSRTLSGGQVSAIKSAVIELSACREAAVYKATSSNLTMRPYAGILPMTEVVIDGAPRRKLLWKQTPLAAGAQHIEDGVQYISKIGGSRSSFTELIISARITRKPPFQTPLVGNC